MISQISQLFILVIIHCFFIIGKFPIQNPVNMDLNGKSLINSRKSIRKNFLNVFILQMNPEKNFLGIDFHQVD